jgi:RNA polymerase sigma factor (sigma-70 family)
VVRQLRKAALGGDGVGLTDGQLLERFVAGGDEDAFAALVRRHGPMVLGVCRRIAGNVHDAEDAFQAAFLVLARKADAIVPRDLVVNWLYGVACRTARKARTAAARRRRRERQVTPMPETEAPRSDPWDDLWPLLDQELGGLPDRYRAPVVLAALAQNKGWACVPAALMAAATRGAVGTGLAAAGGVLSARAIALAEGVLKTMLVNKAGLAVVLFLVVALAGLATRTLTHPAQAGGQAAAPAQPMAEGKAAAGPAGLRETLEAVPWVLMKVDPAGNTISIRMLTQANCFLGDDLYFSNLEELNTWRNVSLPLTPPGSRLAIDDLPVARGAKVVIEGKEGGLAGLKQGMRLTLKLAAGEPAVARIDARSMSSGGDVILKAADADAKTITVTLGGKDLTLTVAADAAVLTNTTGKGQFKDLEPGMRLSLTLGVDRDRIAVKRILARKDLE